jgi:hypothetical protein
MERPTGVTILAVLSFLCAAPFALLALGVFVGGAALMQSIQSASGMGAALAGLGMIIGVGILIGAAL